MMPIVLTLIAARGDQRLISLVDAVREVLGVTADPIWLAPDEACEICFEARERDGVARRIREIIADAPIDLVVQPAASRCKRLLVADLESTIIENEMLDELGSMLGIGERIADITRRAMNGEIDFAQALAARVGLLAGVETGMLAKAATRIRIAPGAQTLVTSMRRAGAKTALVTGGFTIFAEPIGAQLGFDRVIANRLEIAGGRLTGRVVAPIVTGETKRQTVLRLTEEFGIARSETLAVGDGANDVPMLEGAGLGIAFHAKPAVAAFAPNRLDYTDLTGLLYCQGWHKSDFAGSSR